MILLEKQKGGVITARLLLLGYIFLLFSKTVLFRPPQYSYKHHFTPFWSYMAIYQGHNELIAENLLNIVLFIPIGVLLCIVIKLKKWWVILAAGGIVSITIEVCQFAFNRGSAETDDVIHNVLGCLLGYGLFSLYHLFIKQLTNNN